MSERLRSQMRNPWAWFALLLSAGVVLAMATASNGTIVRIADAAPMVSPERACIPIMERAPNGRLTGRVSCASEEQVRQICEQFKEDKDKK